MTAWAINEATAAEIGFAPIVQPSHRKPVSARDRKLIDAFIASKRAAGETVVVPPGVSGMDDEKDVTAANWRGSRTGLSPARRHQLSLRWQEYRALHDKGYKPKKIAKLLHVTVNTVMTNFRQMRIHRARFCRDG